MPTNTLHIMDHTGDVKVTWDPAIPAEVDHARKQFNDAKAKGFAGFEMTSDGKKGANHVREFNPQAGRIVMAPPMQGG